MTITQVSTSADALVTPTLPRSFAHPRGCSVPCFSVTRLPPRASLSTTGALPMCGLTQRDLCLGSSGWSARFVPILFVKCTMLVQVAAAGSFASARGCSTLWKAWTTCSLRADHPASTHYLDHTGGRPPSSSRRMLRTSRKGSTRTGGLHGSPASPVPLSLPASVTGRPCFCELNSHFCALFQNAELGRRQEMWGVPEDGLLCRRGPV